MSAEGAASVASRRAALLVVVLLAAGLLAWSDDLHGWVIEVIAVAEPVIARHRVGGAAIFVGLASLSAMLLFFSSVVLVPIGVQVWGSLGCFFLLWTGWFLGGLITYTVGRTLGRSVVERVISPETLMRFEARLPEGRSFTTALAGQLALPSDVAGYVFGLLDYPPRAFVPALLLAELPYAIGTVFLGTAFVRGQWLVLFSLAALGTVFWLWRRRSGAPSPRQP